MKTETKRTATALVLLTLAFGTAGASDAGTAAGGLPDTPPGRRAREYLAAYHEGEEAMRRFFEDARPASVGSSRDPESRIRTYGMIREMWGDLELHSVLEESAGAIAFLAHAALSKEWLEFRFEIEPREPYGVLSVRIEASGPPEQRSRNYDDGWTKLPDLLERVSADTGIPAIAAAVARDGKVIEEAVIGSREAGGSAGVTPSDRFHIGSVTKSMTATMIGRLVELGDLAWDLALATALPDVEMRPEYEAVTLEQLLQHRGGIPPYTELSEAKFDVRPRGDGSPIERRAAFVAAVLEEAPVARPGTAMHYSNAGYAVAGHIAERATGRSWEELIRAHVFGPLKMKSASFGWPATVERPNQPRGHFKEGDGLRVMKLDEYILGPYLAAAGDVSCSAGDLARYAALHLAGLRGRDGALRSATIRRLHTPPGTGPGEERYAAGWGIEELPSGKVVHWHNGSAGTFNAVVRIFPDDDLAIVVLANAGFEVAELPSEQIIRALRRRITAGAEERSTLPVDRDGGDRARGEGESSDRRNRTEDRPHPGA